MDIDWPFIQKKIILQPFVYVTCHHMFGLKFLATTHILKYINTHLEKYLNNYILEQKYVIKLFNILCKSVGHIF